MPSPDTRSPSPQHRRVPVFLIRGCITGLAACSVRESRYPDAPLCWRGWSTGPAGEKAQAWGKHGHGCLRGPTP
jgi:hypothetical protein